MCRPRESADGSFVEGFNEKDPNFDNDPPSSLGLSACTVLSEVDRAGSPGYREPATQSVKSSVTPSPAPVADYAAVGGGATTAVRAQCKHCRK